MATTEMIANRRGRAAAAIGMTLLEAMRLRQMRASGWYAGSSQISDRR